MSDKIIDEHFWFTATTIGFNFVVLDKIVGKVDFNQFFPVILFINLYAIYLILHRAAAYAQRLVPASSKFEGAKTYADKFKETQNNVWSAIKMLPMVVVEFSGSLFYIILIVASFSGIILLSYKW